MRIYLCLCPRGINVSLIIFVSSLVKFSRLVSLIFKQMGIFILFIDRLFCLFLRMIYESSSFQFFYYFSCWCVNLLIFLTKYWLNNYWHFVKLFYLTSKLHLIDKINKKLIYSHIDTYWHFVNVVKLWIDTWKYLIK